jgi:hypothetical protein
MNENDFRAASDDVWLMNLGYITEHSEQNLMLYGHLAAPGVQHVELMLDSKKLEIHYAIFLNAKSYRWYKLQRYLSSKDGLLSKLMLFLVLRSVGSYDPESRLKRCVTDYAGPVWRVFTEVINVKQYLKITSGGRAEGWVFKDRPRENSGIPR